MLLQARLASDKVARARNVVDDVLNRRAYSHWGARISGRDSDIRYNIMMLGKTFSRRLFGANRGPVAVLRITKALRVDLPGWKTLLKDQVAYIYYVTSQMGKSGIIEPMPLGTRYVAVSLRQHQGVFQGGSQGSNLDWRLGMCLPQTRGIRGENRQAW